MENSTIVGWYGIQWLRAPIRVYKAAHEVQSFHIRFRQIANIHEQSDNMWNVNDIPLQFICDIDFFVDKMILWVILNFSDFFLAKIISFLITATTSR